MSNSQDASLDTCGCCRGVTQSTPQSLENLPGRSVLAYRVGTHATFKASMLAAVSGNDGVRQLTTREDSDPAVGLLDAAATMLDVLTFYQERIANEGYLRTATERLSVLELARQIGYELNPGVAAGTFLAFGLETAPGSPGYAAIPAGTRVQSIPEQDQKPQSFETSSALDARAEWNQLQLKLTEFVLPGMDDDRIYLKGTATNLKTGDAVLMVGRERLRDAGSENWDFRRVKSAVVFPNTDADKSYTLITVDHKLGSHVPFARPAQEDPHVYALRQRANLFGYNAPDWKGMSKQVRRDYLGLPDATDLADYPDWPDLTVSAVSDPPVAAATGTGLSGRYYDDSPYDGHHFKNQVWRNTDARLDFQWGTNSPKPGVVPADNFSVRWTGWVQPKVSGTHTFYANADDGVRVWVNRQRLINSWQDHAATEYSGTINLEANRKYEITVEYYEHAGGATLQVYWSVPNKLAKEIIPTERLYPGDIYTLHLDQVYSQVLAQSWLVLSIPDYEEVYQVVSAVEDSCARFTQSAKVTRLTVRGENLYTLFDDHLRDTAVFCQSEELPMAEQPITRPLVGSMLTLDKRVTVPPAGRTLIVSGLRSRVQVVGSNLKLQLADGSTQVALKDGDRLLLLGAPVAQQGALLRWSLQTREGLTGTVDAPNQRFQYLPSEAGDLTVSEVVTVKNADPANDPTVVELTGPLVYHYDLPTVTVYGNVAPATHGETKNEVLGNGDASKPFQTFTLKNSPLTYVSAPTATGNQTTLEVRVNDIRWKQVDSLYLLGPRERAYITRINDDHTATVEFGDGVNGARLPTGDENVRAIYRVGIGAPGMLKAGQLSQLMNRLLGVQKVVNPLAPTGAADPESREEARQNAPFTVLTLGRIVSLRDYEDFARTYAGIGKAQAAWIWNRKEHILHLTVASSTPVANGILATSPVDYRVDPSSDLYKNLTTAINVARDGRRPVQISTYNPLLFRVRLRLLVDPAYLPNQVRGAVQTALLNTYALKARGFGQPVTRSELLALAQDVEGVQAAFLDSLFLTGQPETLVVPLVAQPARWENEKVQLADLLLIDPNGVFVETIK